MKRSIVWVLVRIAIIAFGFMGAWTNPEAFFDFAGASWFTPLLAFAETSAAVVLGAWLWALIRRPTEPWSRPTWGTSLFESPLSLAQAFAWGLLGAALAAIIHWSKLPLSSMIATTYFSGGLGALLGVETYARLVSRRGEAE